MTSNASIAKMAAVAAVAAAVVWGIARWPAVSWVQRVDREWHVHFTSGEAITVRWELDTRTTEAVLKSQQVKSALAGLQRDHVFTVILEASLVFFGFIAISRVSWVRRHLQAREKQ